MSPARYNVAACLAEAAARAPHRPALIVPSGRDRAGRSRWVQLTFAQLDAECDRYARGFATRGIGPGDRAVILVRPGVEFVALTFALVKLGVVPVFVDPGMGWRAFLTCVAESAPTVFIGIPPAHVLRLLARRPFRTVRHVITAGRRWAWGGQRLADLRLEGSRRVTPAATTTEDDAAVAFTSGSTGIPKGVVFQHGTFRAQIAVLRDVIGIREGEVDMPGLYVFALFNPALGVTTVLPDMDPTRPAAVDPARLVDAIHTHGVTSSFGSPTIWRRVSAYCLAHEIRLPSLRRVLMAGAPVPPGLVADCKRLLDGGEVYTPFGATEALPLTLIAGNEILSLADGGAPGPGGVCVGRPVPGVTVRVIPIRDEPIARWDEALALPPGAIGEIVVQGPVVTRRYLGRPEENARAKIGSPEGVWHRMGDLGWLDTAGRLWFCGRKSHRVDTGDMLLLPVPCEAVFNRHPEVNRTALVGIGPRGRQRPVLVVEPRNGTRPGPRLVDEVLALGATHPHTRVIQDALFHRSFPMDVRHNAKIQRERLAAWAARRLP